MRLFIWCAFILASIGTLGRIYTLATASLPAVRGVTRGGVAGSLILFAGVAIWAGTLLF